jgi:mannose-6-phosphate isomerase-like protein (cupin superfamily)
MANKSRKRKATTRAATKTSAVKSAAAKSTAAKTSPRKPAKSVAKSAAKSSVRRPLKNKSRAEKSKARSAPATKRPRQRIAISHHREEDFRPDGLRAYAHYRDLGIADATHGLARAHVIRMVPPCNPQEVSKLHTHDVEFQMIYVLKGWVRSYLEGVGETLMKEGSAWTRPPKVRHMILDYSDDVELLEVILPADFKTVELTA